MNLGNGIPTNTNPGHQTSTGPFKWIDWMGKKLGNWKKK